MTLRPYQEETIFHLIHSELKRECICLPTGAGKTVIFSTFSGLQAFENKRTLIVVNRQELLSQTAKSIQSAYGILPTIINAKSKALGINKIYLAMVETLHNRKKHIAFLSEHCDNLIIDECHIGSFNKILSYNWKRIIGFSATPIYIKKNDCLKNYYHNLFEPITVSELIEQNYLCKPSYYVPAKALLQGEKLTLNKAKTDYDEAQMGNVLAKPKFIDVLAAYVEKLGKGKRCLIYNASIDHSIRVTSALRQKGYNAWHVDGTTPESERKQILARLFTESDCIVSNVNILTFGFDCPEVEVIFVNRLTLSIALYHQMCGRGSRLSSTITKDNFIIADLYANFEKHGTWNSKVNWQILFEKSGNDTEGIAPMKSCPKCDRLVPVVTKICPECGHEFVAKTMQQEVKEIDPMLIKLEEAKKNLTNIMDRVQQNGNSKYRALHLIKEKIYKENKNASLQDLQTLILQVLPEWCKETQTYHNQWHKDFVKNIMKEHYESNNI
jgi:superfamily II DNA or RNA helicase